MTEKSKHMFKLLAVPLTLLGIYFSMLVIWNIFDFPQGKEMLAIVTTYFNRYGLWIVFIGSFIEGFLILGQYFPGGTIIFLGVSTAGSIPRASLIVVTISLAFIIAYTLNYVLGKYGWYKLLMRFGFGHSLIEAQQKIEKHKFKAIMLSYWDPNLASITATAAGILQVPFREFSLYNVIGVLIWNTVWGTFVYILGDHAIRLFGLKYVLIAFGVWALILILKNYYDKKKLSRADPEK